MKTPFHICGGTVGGLEHQKTGRNNQDAMCWHQGGNPIAAVVADGCGSGAHSEFGARLATQVLCRTLVDAARRHPQLDGRALVAHAEEMLLVQLEQLLHRFAGHPVQLLNDHFLFTLIGAVQVGEELAIFVAGDGLFVVNGALTTLGPFAGNCPPYVGYQLLREKNDLRFRLNVVHTVPMADVQTVLIGTDGAFDLLAGEPGAYTLGELAEFVDDDRYIRNPDMLRRRLTVLNRHRQTVDWTHRRLRQQPGRLPDDTTLILIKRRREELMP